MHPFLFEVNGFGLPAYGTFLTLAFGLGIALAARRANARGLDGDRVIDLGLIVLVAALVGSRLLYAVTHVELLRDPETGWTDVVNPFQSAGGAGAVGLSMMGGVVLATLAGVAYVRWKRLPLLPLADVVAPSALLGEAITRIGCFLNGCCHGVVCSLPWGVRFPKGQAALHFPGEAVHPTQLYTSLLAFVGFLGLLALARRRPAPGVVFCAFLALWGGIRFGVDFVRWYEEGSILFHAGGVAFTIHQAIALGMVLAGGLGLRWIAVRAKTAL